MRVIWWRVERNNREHRRLVIGIDATNLRRGGGVTHLTEILRVAKPGKHGISKVVVWGGRKLLAILEDRPWLEKMNPPELDEGLIRRTLWQRFRLSRAADEAKCDLLFVPGGSYAASFRPIVTMSRNLLPFEWQELRRYGWSLMTVKLLLLRWTQSRSFRNADGVIFLTEHAKNRILSITGKLAGQTPTIPHGLNSRFKSEPKVQRHITEYSTTHPYRLLYVSIIDQYKHQWNVVEAVAALRDKGFPISLDLIGPAYPSALRRLNETIARLDPERTWVRYHGMVRYAELNEKYAQADLGAFASSCENMPNTLLETMAAGLPVACSNRRPMPDILRDAGVYFDPENSSDIVRALRELILSPDVRAEMAAASYHIARGYSWTNCADCTFSFLADLALDHRNVSCVAC